MELKRGGTYRMSHPSLHRSTWHLHLMAVWACCGLPFHLRAFLVHILLPPVHVLSPVLLVPWTRALWTCEPFILEERPKDGINWWNSTVCQLWWKRLILLWKEKKNIQSCLVFYEFIKQIFLMFLSFLFVSDVVTLYIFFFFNYRLITLVSNSATIEPVLWECCRLHIYNVEWKARWEMVCYSDDRRCT